MDGNGLGTVLVVLASVLAAVGLLGLCLIGWVIWRYQVPMRGVVAMFGALIYLLSPIDVLPEGLLGPFGLLDDAGVVGATVLFVYKLVVARRMLAERGVELRRRPPRGPRSTYTGPSGGGFPLDRPARGSGPDVRPPLPDREPPSGR